MNEALFITRKRKKWKFAHFDMWPNCLQATDVTPATWESYFPRQQALTAEIGAGTADLGVGLARLHPERNVIAVDIKSDRLYIGAKAAQQEYLANIAFVRAQLRQIDQLFAPHSISELWVTFPDPFPRKKQAKHRLMHPAFLRTYARLLADGGVLRFKTDNHELFVWSLERLVAEGWRITGLTFDLHESDLPDDYKITTRFERKFMAQDVPICYVSAAAPETESAILKAD